MNIQPFSLALKRPLGTAIGNITQRRGFRIEIEVDDVVGTGEATPLPGWTESYDECRTALMTVENPVTALTHMEETPAARHAVESAVADCRARGVGTSMAAWLGDERPKMAVPVNATVGDEPTKATVAAARAAVDAGFPALKIKVGARAPAADRQRLQAVSAACPDIELRADANGAWSREIATDMVDFAASLGLSYVEQPLERDDLAGHAELRGRGVDIAIDESLLVASVDTVLDHAAADVVVLKPMALGGPITTRNVAQRAQKAGVDTVVTTTIDGAYARAAAVHLAASLPDVRPCGLATGDRLESDLLSHDPVPVDNGQIQVPSGPGQC
jgi:o-succinylbenzoate synthase